MARKQQPQAKYAIETEPDWNTPGGPG